MGVDGHLRDKVEGKVGATTQASVRGGEGGVGCRSSTLNISGKHCHLHSRRTRGKSCYLGG